MNLRTKNILRGDPIQAVEPQPNEVLVEKIPSQAAAENSEDTSESKAEQRRLLAEEMQSWTLQNALLLTLVVLAAFYTIYFTRAILFPITLAVMLNLVFKPIVLRLQQFGIPSVIGATLILVGFASVVLAGALLLWEPASNRVQEITSPGYFTRLAENLRPLQEPLKDLEAASEKIKEITSSPKDSTPVRVQIEQPQLSGMMNITGSLLSRTVIMFVLLFFLLAAGDRFLEKLVVLMPTFKDKRRMVELSREVQHNISGYLFTITAINVGLGVVVGFGLWWIGLPNPILWGVAAAILNYIPFAGPTVGALLVFVEGLGAFTSLAHAALAPAIYVGINTLEANFITPAMLGKSISLNPVMIVLAVVFWGWLWGIGGVLLAVPLLVVLKICFDHSHSLAPIGAFLEH